MLLASSTYILFISLMHLANGAQFLNITFMLNIFCFIYLIVSVILLSIEWPVASAVSWTALFKEVLSASIADC